MSTWRFKTTDWPLSQRFAIQAHLRLMPADCVFAPNHEWASGIEGWHSLARPPTAEQNTQTT